MVEAPSAVKQSALWWPLTEQEQVAEPEPEPEPRWCVFCFLFLDAVLFGDEMGKGQTVLAGGPLVLEDGVDVVHFAQPLEERDEVQELSVGHVVEPRGHRHLDEHRNQSFVIVMISFAKIQAEVHFQSVDTNPDPFTTKQTLPHPVFPTLSEQEIKTTTSLFFSRNKLVMGPNDATL